MSADRARRRHRARPRSTGRRRRRTWPRTLTRALTGCAAGTAATLLALALLPAAWGWHPETVASGSMAPTVRTGDVVLVGPPPAWPAPVGTVLTYRDPDGRLVTHRVVGTGPGRSYVLRGDANVAADAAPVPAERVVGQVRLLVPWVGAVGTVTVVRWPVVALAAVALGFSARRRLRPSAAALFVAALVGTALPAVPAHATRAGFTGSTPSAAGIATRGRFAFSQLVVAKGPISYWPLDETSGTTAHDVVGTTPLTYTAGTTLGVPGGVVGDVDPGIRTTSASHGAQSAANPAALSLTGAVTVMAFVRVSSTATQPSNARVVSKYSGSGNVNYLLAYGAGTTTMRFLVDLTAGSNTRPTATVTLNRDDTWHLLVGTWDGTTARAYLDGVAGVPASVTGAGSMTTVTAPLSVGLPAQPASVVGDVDDVAVWGRALSAAEVSALWAAAS